MFWVLKRASPGQARREREDGLGSTQGKTGQPLGLLGLEVGGGQVPEGKRSRDPGCLARLGWLSTSPKRTQLFSAPPHPRAYTLDLCGKAGGDKLVFVLRCP